MSSTNPPGGSEPPASPRPWPHVRSEHGPDLVVARVRFDDVVNPRNGAELRRTVLEVPAWVNVVARTPEGRVVVIRQYRFGTRAVTTEIPGGVVELGEPHRAAAERELREESGYTAARWTYLGRVEPNPAFQDNLCHHWLAEGAEPTHAQDLDPGEDIAVSELDQRELVDAVRRGEIAHSLVLCALARVFDLRIDVDAGSGAASAADLGPESRE